MRHSKDPGSCTLPAQSSRALTNSRIASILASALEEHALFCGWSTIEVCAVHSALDPALDDCRKRESKNSEVDCLRLLETPFASLKQD